MNKENIEQTNKSLSIQLSSDGFSFCVYDTEKNTYTSFKHIPFSTKAITPNVLLENVKQIFKEEEILKFSFKNITLIHHNELNTYVPQSHFNESLLQRYLENTVKTFDNDFISFDEIDTLKANNVYIPFVNINNFLFDTFGEFTYLHSSSVFLENILKSYTISKKEMFVNCTKNDFQLLVLEDNKLILANHFNCTTKEDFAYYILFAAEQLKMDTNQFQLTLFGEITQQTDTFKLLYNYIRNVSVYAKLNTHLNKEIKVLPQEHYNLLQLHL